MNLSRRSLIASLLVAPFLKALGQPRLQEVIFNPYSEPVAWTLTDFENLLHKAQTKAFEEASLRGAVRLRWCFDPSDTSNQVIITDYHAPHLTPEELDELDALEDDEDDDRYS